jgi:hypothetical protein
MKRVLITDQDIDLLTQKITAIKQMINGLIRYLRGSN